MKDSNARPRQLRFSVFEVDLRTGELRKQGLKVKLQSQPFQILALLLERPGELVTREEIREKLWPEDTFIDFEHSVNSSIKRLREALGDDAAAPRFIETLARQGYRFIAPVEPHHPLTPSSERRGANADSPPASGGGQGVVAVGAIHESPLRRHWVAAVAGGLAVAVVAVLFALNTAGLRDRLLTAVGASVSGRTAPRIESIAVLPLENLSGDPQQEYFADGMTEELITNLGKISALRVISRTSVMQYKGTKKPLPQIARELSVDAIVEGTVQRSGDRVRITANLLHAPTDRHLWAETYERDLRDVLSLQGEVARAIADEIKVKVLSQEQARLASVRQANPEAQDAYLRGRYHLNKRTRRDLRRAAAYFQEAIQKEPGYALAYASLADVYFLYGQYAVVPPRESLREARAAAQKALEIDPELGEARTVLAATKFYYEWDWAAAETEFRQALELSPSYAPGHQYYGEYLEQMGRHKEAIGEIERAQKCDPLSPILPAMEGWAFFAAHDYDRAIASLRKAIDMDPNFPRAHWYLGGVYVQKGMWQEAMTEFQKATTLDPDDPDYLAWLGHAYAAVGKTREATAVLERLKSTASRRYVSPFEMAALCTGLHRKDDAFVWLEKGYEERDSYMACLRFEPSLDPLRSDPRFQDLLRRMNFPP
jgi:TolB-like protein/DNA-binding winged helix-turn-helix (wHTH) protein/Flp pilus assembly protein TadD